MFEQEEIDISTFNKRYVGVGAKGILVKEPTDAMVPTITGHLESGDVPLLIEANGDTKLVCKISESAYNVKKLLLVCGGIYYIDENGKSTPINDIEDYLEVIV